MVYRRCGAHQDQLKNARDVVARIDSHTSGEAFHQFATASNKSWRLNGIFRSICLDHFLSNIASEMGSEAAKTELMV